MFKKKNCFLTLLGILFIIYIGLYLMDNLGCENFKAVFDPANFVQCGVDTLKAYELLEDHIEYFHIKDALAENGMVVPAGEGDGRIREVFAKLEQAGYEGFLSLEPHLTDFAGLAQLEREEDMQGKAVEKLEEKKGALAYELAHRSLCEILQ